MFRNVRLVCFLPSKTKRAGSFFSSLSLFTLTDAAPKSVSETLLQEHGAGFVDTLRMFYVQASEQ
jgi:hypothetical protein